jgi:hypothetical protein
METSGNQVTLKGGPKGRLEVSIIEKKGDKTKKIERFMDVKMDKHKVLMTLKFQ